MIRAKVIHTTNFREKSLMFALGRLWRLQFAIDPDLPLLRVRGGRHTTRHQFKPRLFRRGYAIGLGPFSVYLFRAFNDVPPARGL